MAEPRIPASQILEPWSREMISEPVLYVVHELTLAGYRPGQAYSLVGDHLQSLGIQFEAPAARCDAGMTRTEKEQNHV